MSSLASSQDDFEIEDAARTLRRAAEIRQDPKLLEKAQKYMEKEVEALKVAQKMTALEVKVTKGLKKIGLG